MNTANQLRSLGCELHPGKAKSAIAYILHVQESRPRVEESFRFGHSAGFAAARRHAKDPRTDRGSGRRKIALVFHDVLHTEKIQPLDYSVTTATWASGNAFQYLSAEYSDLIGGEARPSTRSARHMEDCVGLLTFLF